jgi:hypothetical protein
MERAGKNMDRRAAWNAGAKGKGDVTRSAEKRADFPQQMNTKRQWAVSVLLEKPGRGRSAAKEHDPPR